MHHDSPLACRIPARPLGSGFDVGRVGVGGAVEGAEWVPLGMCASWWWWLFISGVKLDSCWLGSGVNVGLVVGSFLSRWET